jgi:predicted nucleotidyltransferase
MRCVPDHFDKQAVSEIDRRLADIAANQKVKIVWAIESGSRAWGFPSPDSDYDARFIYVRSIDQYLSPWTPRDVIEMPIEGDMDVNGWDLGKAIKLMLKGNAVVLEWLQSSIVYGGDKRFQSEMLALANQCADRMNAMRHYFHLGTQQWERFLALGDEAPAKKLFYSARPALCLRWLRVHRDRSVPPMHFQTLMQDAETPTSIRIEFEELVAAKAQTRELGNTSISEGIRAFINAEYQLANEVLPQTTASQPPENLERANAFFYSWVTAFSAG